MGTLLYANAYSSHCRCGYIMVVSVSLLTVIITILFGHFYQCVYSLPTPPWMVFMAENRAYNYTRRQPLRSHLQKHSKYTHRSHGMCFFVRYSPSICSFGFCVTSITQIICSYFKHVKDCNILRVLMKVV